jgi:hypothetical protein
MNRKFSAALVVVFSLFITWRCTKEMGVLPKAPPPPPGKCDTITYAGHVKSVIDQKCVSCHSSTGTAYKDRKLDSYQLVKNAADEGILRDVLLGANGRPKMPYGTSGLPQQELDLVMCWIENGGKP